MNITQPERLKTIAQHYKLKGSRVLVFISLLDLCLYDDKKFYATLKTIARKTGLSSNFLIVEALNELEQCRLIQIHYCSDSLMASRLYQIELFPHRERLSLRNQDDTH